MLQKIRYFLFLTAVLVVIVVAFQNHHPVQIELLTFRGEYPLTLLLLSTAVVSFILGSILTAWRVRKREKSKAREESKSREKADKASQAPKDAPVSSSSSVSSRSSVSSGETSEAASAEKSPLER